jgi:hypothetical protein
MRQTIIHQGNIENTRHSGARWGLVTPANARASETARRIARNAVSDIRFYLNQAAAIKDQARHSGSPAIRQRQLAIAQRYEALAGLVDQTLVRLMVANLLSS